MDIKLYLEHLSRYDYMAFVLIGLATLLIVIIAFILLFKKKFFIFLILILFSPIFTLSSAYGAKYILDNSIRKSKTIINKIKPLSFSNSLLIEGVLKNKSKKIFNICKIHLVFYKKYKNNRLKNFISMLKPIRKKSILVDEKIEKGSSYIFKKIIDDIRYKEEIAVSTKSECYR